MGPKVESTELKKKLIIHLDTAKTILLTDFTKKPDLSREDAVLKKNSFINQFS